MTSRALCTAVGIVLLMSFIATGQPEIKHIFGERQAYYKVPFTVSAWVKAEQGIKHVMLYYRSSVQAKHESVEMVAFPELKDKEGFLYYEASIPGRSVVKGLRYYIEAEPNTGPTAKVPADRPKDDPDYEIKNVEHLPIDPEPVLNRDPDYPDVKQVQKVPQLFWGLWGAGTDTRFGSSIPGYLWVPVEIRDFGLLVLIEGPSALSGIPFIGTLSGLSDQDVRKEIYKEVMFHMLMQDGLVDKESDFQRWLDREFRPWLKSAGTLHQLTDPEVDKFIQNLKMGQYRLNYDDLSSVSDFLDAQRHYTGISKKLSEIWQGIGKKIAILKLAGRITSDTLQTLRYQALITYKSFQRLEAFKKTKFYVGSSDPALRAAIDEISEEIQKAEENIIDKFIEAASKAIELEGYVLDGAALIAALKHLKIGPYLIAADVVWNDVFKEADVLKLLIATATLEKSFWQDALYGKDFDDPETRLLRQMKAYLGYYYARTYLRIRGSLTLHAANFWENLGLEERFKRMEDLEDFSKGEYARLELPETVKTCPPEDTLSLQQAVEKGYIQLESKGGYMGDQVTLIATGKNTKDITVVACPGDVLLPKSIPGTKQTLVVSKYDETHIPANTPADTILKRGENIFCIDAEGSGPQAGERLDVGPNLRDWPQPEAKKLLQLLAVISRKGLYESELAQRAIWAVTNAQIPSSTDMEVRNLLSEAGIDPDKDITYFPVLENPNRESPNSGLVPLRFASYPSWLTVLGLGLLVCAVFLTGTTLVISRRWRLD